MALTKKQIIATIEAMPKEEFESAEEVIGELILLEKIDEGMNDMKERRVIAHEEMKKEIDSWFTR
jgi:predicted transcriptional regulator